MGGGEKARKRLRIRLLDSIAIHNKIGSDWQIRMAH